MMIDVQHAKIDPASVFHYPEEVLDSPDLTLSDKISILKQWKYDALELMVAEEENMSGGEVDLLDAISLALNKLQCQLRH
jgi:hypothetical protein